MSRRFRPTDAFVDESVRGQRYLMGCVLAEANALADVRAELRALVTRSKRLHFHNESDQHRAALLAVFAQLPIRAAVVSVRRRHGMTESAARVVCLGAIVDDLQQRKVARLVLESRDDDRDDAHAIRRARKPKPPLVFEHRLPVEEPLLWIADGITWAVGAGVRWARLVEPVLWAVEELQP